METMDYNQALRMLEGAENILGDPKNVSNYDQCFALRAIIAALRILLEQSKDET